MTRYISMLKQTRQHLVGILDGLSTDELNDIPFGFNNNLVWHIGHLVASQQGICYKRAGIPMNIDDAVFETYKPGTKPEKYVDQQEIDSLKTSLLSAIDRFDEDYNKGIFKDYPSWTTRYGVELNNIDEAITFLLFHEGLHLGYVMALKRLVTKQ